jgi:hypothetical protein
MGRWNIYIFRMWRGADSGPLQFCTREVLSDEAALRVCGFTLTERLGGNTSKNGSNNRHFRRPFHHEYHLRYIYIMDMDLHYISSSTL